METSAKDRKDINMMREAIKKRIDELGVNESYLAEGIHTTRQYVSQFLQGREHISLRTFAKMADYLGCDVDIQLVPREHKESVNLF